MRRGDTTECCELHCQLLCRTIWLSHCYCYALGLLHNIALISLEVLTLTTDFRSV